MYLWSIEIDIMRVLEGHITVTEKKHIKAILDANLTEGQIGRKVYYLSEDNGVYTVKVTEKVRGIGLGAALRTETFTSKFTS